jgi:hypothetical protein
MLQSKMMMVMVMVMLQQELTIVSMQLMSNMPNHGEVNVCHSVNTVIMSHFCGESKNRANSLAEVVHVKLSEMGYSTGTQVEKQ